MSEKKRLPHSDFGKTVGESVTVHLNNASDLASLDLPVSGNALVGRLVGVDRPGLWLEPKVWFDDSLKQEKPVRHLFLKWENVLGLTRELENELFEDKKEYRGLRPRQ